MTREEAIKILKEDGCGYCTWQSINPYECENKECKVKEALNMAIQALSQEPCEVEATKLQQSYNKGFEDCRQAAIEAVSEGCQEWRGIYGRCEELINALPSVTQKSGKWIEHPEIETSTPEYLMFYECSECGDKQCFCKSDIHKKRFCSNCGAKMESEANNG